MGQILAVTCLYLNRRCKLLNIEELRFFEFGVINHENLCGKLAKNAKNNSFSIWLKFIYDSIYGNLWVISLSLSLSKWCIVEHCKTSEAKQLFSCLGIFQTDTQTKHDIPLCVSIGFQFRHTPMNRSYCCTVASA